MYLTALNDQGIDLNDRPIPNNEEIDISSQYTKEEIENFRCIFEMFDKDKSGFVEI